MLMKKRVVKLLKYAAVHPKVVKAAIVVLAGSIGYELGSRELSIIDGLLHILGVFF
jgi:hypothetical protein